MRPIKSKILKRNVLFFLICSSTSSLLHFYAGILTKKQEFFFWIILTLLRICVSSFMRHALSFDLQSFTLPI